MMMLAIVAFTGTAFAWVTIYYELNVLDRDLGLRNDRIGNAIKATTAIMLIWCFAFICEYLFDSLLWALN